MAAESYFEHCGKWGVADSYRTSVTETVDHPTLDGILVSLTVFPSFQSEWGVRILHSGDRTLLRSVDFHDSVWYSALAEVEDGYYDRIPSKARYSRRVREVTLSDDIAQLLRQVTARESQRRRPYAESELLSMGFDGTTYLFSAGSACGTTWSPERHSRAGKLVDSFYGLRTQAALPTRFLQYAWERRTYAKLLDLEGRQMTPWEYLVFATTALAFVAAAALPLLVAGLVALLNHSLPRRRLYIFSTAAMSYGIACIAALPLAIFIFVGDPLAAQLSTDGYSAVAAAVEWITRLALWIILLLWSAASFTVPILLRRRWRLAFEEHAG